MTEQKIDTEPAKGSSDSASRSDALGVVTKTMKYEIESTFKKINLTSNGVFTFQLAKDSLILIGTEPFKCELNANTLEILGEQTMFGNFIGDNSFTSTGSGKLYK